MKSPIYKVAKDSKYTFFRGNNTNINIQEPTMSHILRFLWQCGDIALHKSLGIQENCINLFPICICGYNLVIDAWNKYALVTH